MNRRSFLAAVGLAAFAATSGLARAAIEVKSAWVLVADGVHDDTDALQAALNGEEVFDTSGRLVSVGGSVHLPPGPIRVTQTLEIKSNSSLIGGTIRSEATDCYLHAGRGVQGALVKDILFVSGAALALLTPAIKALR